MTELRITGQTRLADLVSAYPGLKEKLPEVNPKFSMINSPIGAVMLKKVTIADMSQRSGMDQAELIEKLGAVIERIA
ncbi:MAG: DUF1858 domain-containing protein [Firmicutes bacterium]|nr:DUF1858 domain-containing protein [Bacillota bacterium]